MPTNPRTYAGLPLDARMTMRRDRLIEAGTALLGAEGYRKLTVRAVCKEAQLTDRYFYESFASTEALFWRCMNSTSTK